MLRTLFRVTLPLPLLLTALMLAVRLGYSVTYPAQPAPALFTHPDCENPCWLGVQPGVHSPQEANEILNQHGIFFSAPEDTLNMFAHFEGSIVQVQENFREPVIDTIRFMHISCPIAIFQHYGLPDAVIRETQSTKYQLVYAEGIYVTDWTNLESPKRFELILVPERNASQYYEWLVNNGMALSQQNAFELLVDMCV
ncbi:MAG: hypothetical protein AAF787_13775 [Chloroflexota bacterium]